MLPTSETDEMTVEDYLMIFKRRSRLMLAFLVVIPLLVAVAVFMIKPTYRATASILIEKVPPKVTKFEESYQLQYYEEYFQSQYSILTSRTLAEAVFNELDLGSRREYGRLKDPIKKLRDNITIELLKKSQIILIHVDDTDPAAASSIANTLARLYIKQDIDSRNRTSKEAAVWLDEQLADIKKKMQDSEEALNRYIQENRIVAVPDIDKKTETLLESMKVTKSRIETDLAEASKRYKEKHPRIISLEAQLNEITEKIDSETSKLLELNQKMVQYNLYKKESESNQEVYTSILQSAKEKGISEKLDISGIRIIDLAKPPQAPFKPKKFQSILIAIFASLLCGGFAAVFLEYKDSTVRTADDVRRYVGLPFLGYIPASGKEGDKNLICYKDPASSIPESYRMLRTSILFAAPEGVALKTILVAPVMSGQNTSLVASNLALIFSQKRERVALVDVDVQNPVVHKAFNVKLEEGLSDYVSGVTSIDAIAKLTPAEGLFLITPGVASPDPDELFTSGRMRSFLEDATAKFNRVIMNAPPVLATSGVSILANMADAVVLVISSGRQQLQQINAAKEKILQAKGRIIGIVITDINMERQDAGYYHYHYFNENRFGGKTGF